MSSGIRKDVQIIRGFAILSVLGFHFFPKTFPNGYLGVDQFFVISGYLMCLLLHKSSEKPWYSLIAHFYFRRLKRILPLYFLIIFATLLSISWISSDFLFVKNLKSAQKALFFMSNIPEPEKVEIGYFRKLTENIDFFTHCWSLSLEVQFYFLVPFLYILIRNFSLQIQIFGFSVFGIFSLFYFAISVGSVSFNSVFARIWQFMAGMIVFLASEIQNSENFEIGETSKFLEDSKISENQGYLQNYSNLILYSTVIITTYAVELKASIFRFLVAILTSLFIFSSSDSKSIIDRLLIYTGNISYVLYLIHWPLYSIWKSQTEGFSDFHRDIEDVDVQNREWNWLDDEYLKNPVTGKWKGLSYRQLPRNGTGKFKFRIIGSSTAARLSHLIQDECGFLASQMIQLTVPTCEPFYPTTELGSCTENSHEFQKIVDKEKPDYLIIASRFYNMGHPLPQNITDMEYDPILAIARNELQKYMGGVSRKIIILHAFPRNNYRTFDRIVRWMAQKMAPEIIDKKVIEPLENGYNMARQRYEILLKECGSKCEIIDYHDIFLNPKTDFVRYFNEIGLHYFTRNHHLTPLAFEIVRPHVRDICNKFDEI
ncbi:hypothetical protein B9Z55_027202 [Caenorhabditis nigoni]|uniref:Acyl_transf_3 domain-containing protein n=1 Tax=Caenorhabditis nigoni TaxID=1611254 RepID=A0A2G5SGM4_9PELO|nr:hypothetical protein B9Z55_027202 [Caenorhabditis nigoni]